jgi:hypothetical protein
VEANGALPGETLDLNSWSRALTLGLLLAVGQVVFVCATSGAATAGEAYLRLFQWDASWYSHIAEHGYRNALPPASEDRESPSLRLDKERSNVAFFPGFPLFARAVMTACGLPVEKAVLLASQLASWGFWTYLLLFFQRWGVSLVGAAAGTLAVLVQPTAFYLVTGYSESLFLFALLGFLFWAEQRGPGCWLLAAGHGVLMTATRIIGLPLALCPLAVVLALDLRHRGTPLGGRWRQWGSAALLGVASMLGAAWFFAYCQLRFGDWSLYMRSQRTGWGIEPDYLTLFRPETYRLFLPSVTDLGLLADDLSRLSIPVTLGLFFVLFVLEWRLARSLADTGWTERLGFYLAAWLMFYLAVCGLKNRNMVSMIRYSFPVYVMLVLAVTHLLRRVGPGSVRGRAFAAVAFGLAAVPLMALQTIFAGRYTHSEWVA